jgi:hypothetical protein
MSGPGRHAEFGSAPGLRAVLGPLVRIGCCVLRRRQQDLALRRALLSLLAAVVLSAAAAARADAAMSVSIQG